MGRAAPSIERRGHGDTEMSRTDTKARKYPFFAFLGRLRYIRRWGLMRSTEPENVLEHSYMVAVIAHALTVLRRRRSPDDGPEPGEVAIRALFHDAAEVFTGDFPSPVKHHGEAIESAVRDLEDLAARRLLSTLPQGLWDTYAPLLARTDGDADALVHAADKISAWLRCLEESRTGNGEFAGAERALRRQIEECGVPEAQEFVELFAEPFRANLDELHHWLPEGRVDEAEAGPSGVDT